MQTFFLGVIITDLYSISQQGGKEQEVTGSPTEKAILSWGLKVQIKPTLVDFALTLSLGNSLYC
jgi:hypothetical protein